MIHKNYKAPVTILMFSMASFAVMPGCNAPSTDALNSGNSGPGTVSAVSDYAVMNQCLSPTASLVGFSNTAIQITGNGTLDGNVALLGSSTLDLTGNAKVSGNVFTPSSDQVTETGNASAGQIVDDDLTGNESAVLNYSDSLNALSETQSLGEIASSMTLQGNGSLNVINVNGDISLSGNDSLILNGGSQDLFLINVNGNVTVSGKASIEVSGSLPATNVLFRLVGSGGTVTLSGKGTVMGTFFAPRGSAQVTGNGVIEGSIFAWNSIVISGNGFTFSPAPFCPGNFLPAPSPSPSPSSSTTPSPSPSPSASSCTGPFCGGGLLGQ